jgi:hypothetical protein
MEHEVVPAHDGASDEGTDVEYVVTEVRGVLVFFRSVSGEGAADRTMASVLAANLRLNAEELVGQHFVCHEVRDPYGVTQSGFRLADADADRQ